MLTTHGLSNCLDDLGYDRFLAVAQFLDHNKAFLISNVDRKGCCASRSQHLVTPCHAQFYIVGIKVAPSYDNHVFQAPPHVQIVLENESQVPCSQIWTISRAA